MTERRPDAAREALIVDTFVRLSDTLVDDYDVIEFLHYLTASCVALGEVDEAAVMLASHDGRLRAVASSTERTWLLELFELQNDEGPCLDAFRTGSVVAADDLSLERDRWPIFATQAIDVGFRAVHSVPLRLRERTIGALNLMCVEPGGVTSRDAHVLRAFADIATVAVLQERDIAAHAELAGGLQTALTSRIRIEQAKGVLAERHGVSVDDAFGLLRGHARALGLRLTDVAEAVADRTLEIVAESTDTATVHATRTDGT